MQLTGLFLSRQTLGQEQPGCAGCSEAKGLQRPTRRPRLRSTGVGSNRCPSGRVALSGGTRGLYHACHASRHGCGPRRRDFSVLLEEPAPETSARQGAHSRTAGEMLDYSG